MDLLEKMATYVRVVDAGSFAAAAKQLKITSSAVSRQIAALETDLGVTLIARSTRAMAVTSEGHRYYERCRRVLHEVDEAQSIAEPRGVEGTIRVSAPVSFGLGRLIPHVATLRAKYPPLTVELHLEDRLLDSVLEGLDVLVRAGITVAATGGLIARRLTAFPFVLAAAPSYLAVRGEPRTPEALVTHEALSCHVAPGPDVWSLSDGRRDARVTMTDAVRFRCGALQCVHELARAGHGVALLPDWLVAPDIATGVLRPVLQDWATDVVTVSAIYRTSQRATPRIHAFVTHLVDAFAMPTAPAGAASRRTRARDS